MTNTTALVPLAEVQQLATAVARSGLFQAFRNPEQALVLMMVAQVEGCHPMQAMQRYDVVQGKPAKKADAMLADFQLRGGTIRWTEYTDDAVEAEFTSKGMAAPCKVRWSYKQAEAAGLTGKPTWKQFKRQMLKARVISEGIRIADPGVVAGLYTPEEVQDFSALPPSQPNPHPEAIDVTASQTPHNPVTGEVLDAEVVTPNPAPTDERAKNARVKVLAVAIKDAGIPDGERSDWMSVVLDRPVSSSKDLTVGDVDRLIVAANKRRDEISKVAARKGNGETKSSGGADRAEASGAIEEASA